MAETLSPTSARSSSALYAILVAGPVPLFLGVLLSDVAYSSTYELQWKNFASWLLVGGLAFCGLALLGALGQLVLAARRTRRSILFGSLLLATFIIGFIDALVHAKDAWASMPAALVLSVIVAPLALAAAWLGVTPAEKGRQ